MDQKDRVSAWEGMIIMVIMVLWGMVTNSDYSLYLG